MTRGFKNREIENLNKITTKINRIIDDCITNGNTVFKDFHGIKYELCLERGNFTLYECVEANPCYGIEKAYKEFKQGFTYVKEVFTELYNNYL